MDVDNETFQSISLENGSMEAVVEEIEELEGINLTLGKSRDQPPISFSPTIQHDHEREPSEASSPLKVAREFGNISPISELLDDDVEVISQDGEESIHKSSPEPGLRSMRNSFPRISDGRTSPILAFSPSLVKSPSSNKCTAASRTNPNSTSPSSSGGGVSKRPRNIARMLDNISDHSSSEDDVNAVGVLMAKFTV